MRAPDHYLPLETMIGDGLRPLINELRLIDLAHLADHVLNDRSDCLREVIAGAAETHFAPGFIRYGGEADIDLDWCRTPAVSIAIALCAGALEARVQLILKPQSAFIALQLLDLAGTGNDPPAHAASRLAQTLSQNRLTSR